MNIPTPILASVDFWGALSYQVTGMCVVICCLVALSLILTVSGSVAVRMESKRKAAAEAAKAALAASAPAPAPVPVPVPTPAAPAPTPAEVAALAAGIYDAAASSITPEVVAALAAAVKVTVGNEARILDIRPVDPGYAASGRASIMNSHQPFRG